MAEDYHPSYVPGLVNFGNTCFVNALLQALASCPSLLSYLTLLENAFHNCRLPRVWNGCFDAPMLWAAKGPLIRALEDCMDRLQPRDSEEQLPARWYPSHAISKMKFGGHNVTDALEVLHALVQHNQKPFAHSDQQQDICEALESVMDSLQKEVKRWLEIQENPCALRQKECYSLLTSKMSQYSIATNPRVLRNLLSSGPSVLPSSDLVKFHLRKLASNGPFNGLLAHALRCKGCGHCFTTRMNPFTVLMLPIPEVERDGRRLVVTRDISLQDCLEAYFQEGEQGPISCPKCSLLTTVATLLKGNETAVSSLMNIESGMKQAYRKSGATLRCSVDGASLTESSKSSSWNTLDGLLREGRRSSEDCSANGARSCVRGNAKGLATLVDIQDDNARFKYCRGGAYFRRSASFDVQSFRNGGLEPTRSPGRLVWNVVQEAVGAIVDDEFDTDAFDAQKRSLKDVKVDWLEEKSLVTAQTLIGRLPQILAISIQRKVFTSLGFEKIYGKLSFPIILDVERHLHMPTPQGSKFELQSVVVHQGSHVGGHFVAARRIPSAHGGDQWLFASDMRVKRVSERFVMDLESCLLFYERIAPPPKIDAKEDIFFFPHD